MAYKISKNLNPKCPSNIQHNSWTIIKGWKKYTYTHIYNTNHVKQKYFDFSDLNESQAKIFELGTLLEKMYATTRSPHPQTIVENEVIIIDEKYNYL